MILKCSNSSLFGFIFPDQEKLRVGDTAILVHIQLRDTLPSLLHLVSSEMVTVRDNSHHLIFSDEATVVSVQLGELLPDLLLALALALDGGPELGELGEVDALVAVLVRLMDETLSLALSHGPADLLHELPKFVLGDHTVTIHVEQLKSLLQFNVVCHL